MTGTTQKRGERKARWMLARISNAGLTFDRVRDDKGHWGLRFHDVGSQSPEQREIIKDACYFALGYPRCFATMLRLIREREAQS